MVKKFSIFSILFSLATLLAAQTVRTGADCTEAWLPLVKGKKVAMMVNQTSVINTPEGSHRHLVDSALALGVDVRFLMSPEHGLKGTIGAGAKVGSTTYGKLTKLPVYSLYGDTKKPKPEWLKEADVVIFDVQDVGCRFYTYLSTLYYVLEACGEENKKVIVFDRPNPNDTIDGPVLDPAFKSFVGMIEVPILHGCTLGELAQMMLGEWWEGKPKPKLEVVKCENWQHGQPYSLPIAPSPNLQNDHAIKLYPSLCLFEGTSVSVGRGTNWPFEVFGHPVTHGSFKFTPRRNSITAHPLQENQQCNGYDLRKVNCPTGFHMKWLIMASRQVGGRMITSRSFFDRLAGTDQLRLMMEGGKSEYEMRASWQEQLTEYRLMRLKYVIY